MMEFLVGLGIMALAVVLVRSTLRVIVKFFIFMNWSDENCVDGLDYLMAFFFLIGFIILCAIAYIIGWEILN